MVVLRSLCLTVLFFLACWFSQPDNVVGHHHKGKHHGLETLLTAGVLAKVLQKKGGGGHHHHPIFIPIPVPVHKEDHHHKEHHHKEHHHKEHHHHHGSHHMARFQHPPYGRAAMPFGPPPPPHGRHPSPPFGPGPMQFSHQMPFGPAFQGSHTVETYSL